MNNIFKNALIFIAIGLICLFAYAAFNDSKEKIIRDSRSRVVEIKGSQLNGFSDGQLSWQLKADYIWAGRSKYLFRADGVSEGLLYNNEGKMSVQNLSANKVRVNSKTKSVSAYDSIFASFLRRNDPSSKKSVDISANELRYFGKSKKTYIFKNVVMKQDTVTIYPERSVDIDNNTNIVVVDGRVFVQSEDFSVTGNRLKIMIDDDLASMQNIEAKRIGRPTTNQEIDEREREFRAESFFLKAQTMLYSNPQENTIVTINGQVKMTHGQKKISANHVFYNKEEKYYIMEGKVSIEADSIEWLLKSEQRRFNNEELQKSIYEPISIRTDKLTFDANERIIRLLGAVIIIQSDKSIKANKVEFLDKEGLVILSGDVEIKKENKDTLRCEALRIDINNETFESNEAVFMEFFLKK
jgi:lipopolysaccharide assembly outer membrane protein LptD (OstA)